MADLFLLNLSANQMPVLVHSFNFNFYCSDQRIADTKPAILNKHSINLEQHNQAATDELVVLASCLFTHV